MATLQSTPIKSSLFTRVESSPINISSTLASLRLKTASDAARNDASLSISLDAVPQDPFARPEVRARGDGMKRREAAMRGNEGSRRRQKWENDRLIGNPHAQPPLPIDWEVRPTYPVHTVPYALANLWDAREREREVARAIAERKKAEQDNQEVGRVPKTLRQRLKKSRGAKGLLQDLEAEVRKFVETWEEVEGRDVETVPDAGREDEDDEYVFVPPSPVHKRGISLESVHIMQKEKLVYSNSMDADDSAKFIRYLVHCLGRYYDLDTWSVTKPDPARREAYVGIKGMPIAAPVQSRALLQPLWAMV